MEEKNNIDGESTSKLPKLKGKQKKKIIAIIAVIVVIIIVVSALARGGKKFISVYLCYGGEDGYNRVAFGKRHITAG